MRNESCRNCVNFSEYEVTRECLECFPNGRGPKYFAQKEVKKTHADRIREMTDEELAEWLCEVAGWLPLYEGRVHPILEWLKQEDET